MFFALLLFYYLSNHHTIMSTSHRKMYKLNKKVGIFLVLAITYWATGLPGTLFVAQAAQLSSLKDTISTSAPGVGADHTIEFTTPTGVPADGSTIVISMPTGFDVTSITEDDVDITDDTVDLTTDTVCGAVNAAVTISGQDITIEICNGGGGAIAADSAVAIEIGTNATASGTGANQVVNHADEGSYTVSVAGTMEDSGDTSIAIVESVQVSAAVGTLFTFSVTGVDEGVTVNDETVLTSASTTATSVPFGTLAPNVPKVLAQELRVDTNALNGFSVTIEADQTLTAGNNATIDAFADGSPVASTTTWSKPSGTVGSTDTYGHWGITSDDDDISGLATDNWGVGEAAYRGDFINNPLEVFFNDGPVTSSSGVGVGSTTVAFKIEVSPLQEAATDYTANIMYIATPVF